MMKRYTNYKTFIKHNGLSYPIGSDFVLENGRLVHSGQFMCMVESQKANDCMVGNDDGKGLDRGNLITEINQYLYNPINYDNKNDQLEALWADEKAIEYCKHNSPEDGAWLWNSEFYCAALEDLEYIKTIFETVRAEHDYSVPRQRPEEEPEA